ncbi:MAG: hypothetical protein ACOY37_08055 [Pseudomonadota bacterium]
MSETPNDPKIVRLPVAVAPPSDAQRREALLEEILELLEDDAPADTAAEARSVQEWIPAEPKPAPAPVLPDAPPPHHRNATECPQCDRWTWRGTDHCRWCGFSLSDHYALLEQEKQIRRAAQLRDATIRLRRRMLMTAFGLVVAGATISNNASLFPEPIRGYIVYTGFAVVAAGALVSYCIPR